MAQGIKKLRKILLGRETTAGTNTTGANVWRGEGTSEDQQELIFIPEDIGYYSGVNRTAIPKVRGFLAMDSTPATFEQFKHICEAGIMTATPTTDGGAGTGKIYTYTFPTTTAYTAANIKTYSLEFGDNAGAEEMSYAFVESFALQGEVGGVLNMSANWVGRQLAPIANFTTNPVLPSVETILFSKGVITLDSAGATVVTTSGTAKTNTLLGASLDVVTGYKDVYTGEGQLYFSFLKNIGPEITAHIIFEHETNSIAEKVFWRAETPRQLQLRWLGSAVTTGTTYSFKQLSVIMSGKWEKFSKIGERDGNDIIEADWRAGYDTTNSKFATITVVDLEASVP